MKKTKTQDMETMKKWRYEMRFTQSQAARALDRSRAFITNTERGVLRLNTTVRLAMSALLAGLKPY